MSPFAGENSLRMQVPMTADLTALLRALRAEADGQGFHIVGTYAGEPIFEFRQGRVSDLVRDLEESIALDRFVRALPITSKRATPEGSPQFSGAA